MSVRFKLDSLDLRKYKYHVTLTTRACDMGSAMIDYICDNVISYDMNFYCRTEFLFIFN